MLSDSGTGENGLEESITPESPLPSTLQPSPLPLFAVQLQNILPVEIVARRFPEEKTTNSPEQINPPNAQLSLGEPEFNIETRQAQILMEVKVDPVEEPHLFEISVKIIGVFSYSPGYSLEEGYRANVGFVTFDDDQYMKRKLARLQPAPVIQFYGLDSIGRLQASPF